MPKPKAKKQRIIETAGVQQGAMWRKECTRCHHGYDVQYGYCPVCQNPEFGVVEAVDEEAEAIEVIAKSLQGYDWRSVSLEDLVAIQLILEGVYCDNSTDE